MKKHTQLSAGLLLMSLMLVGAGCMNKTAPTADMPEDGAMMEEETETAAAIEAGVYQVQSSQSVVEWYGEKRVGGSHDGSVDIAYGQVSFDESGALVNGTFTLDMTTIDSYEDIEQLEGHLNSEDFFDTENHPEAMFTITSAEMTAPGMYNVTGDLTIKGITNEVTFPATVVSEASGTVRATASFEVDRALFDVRFGSPNFFTDLGDGLIENMMKFDLNLVATKVSDMGMMEDSEEDDSMMESNDEGDDMMVDVSADTDVTLEQAL